MKQILLRTAVILTIVLSTTSLFGCGPSLDERFEDYLIERYDLPENLEENHIYYESYATNSSGEKIKYTLYTNDKINGLRIIDEDVVFTSQL